MWLRKSQAISDFWCEFHQQFLDLQLIHLLLEWIDILKETPSNTNSCPPRTMQESLIEAYKPHCSQKPCLLVSGPNKNDRTLFFWERTLVFPKYSSNFSLSKGKSKRRRSDVFHHSRMANDKGMFRKMDVTHMSFATEPPPGPYQGLNRNVPPFRHSVCNKQSQKGLVLWARMHILFLTDCVISTIHDLQCEQNYVKWKSRGK